MLIQFEKKSCALLCKVFYCLCFIIRLPSTLTITCLFSIQRRNGSNANLVFYFSSQTALYIQQYRLVNIKSTFFIIIFRISKLTPNSDVESYKLVYILYSLLELSYLLYIEMLTSKLTFYPCYQSVIQPPCLNCVNYSNSSNNQ